MDITSASFRSPALWLDGDLMQHLARPLRLDNVAESLKCRGIRNASAPYRVQPPPAPGNTSRARWLRLLRRLVAFSRTLMFTGPSLALPRFLGFPLQPTRTRPQALQQVQPQVQPQAARAAVGSERNRGCSRGSQDMPPLRRGQFINNITRIKDWRQLVYAGVAWLGDCKQGGSGARRQRRRAAGIKEPAMRMQGITWRKTMLKRVVCKVSGQNSHGNHAFSSRFMSFILCMKFHKFHDEMMNERNERTQSHNPG
ncbi:hypothetical protein HaLaN_20126 [Haematococcus lacustris]|uniref:Uncharacterized protein n=1 Tax=Haematococcus lacustris TaxID=44745 RepID=A0A699ZK37_HAELA|nr:hypothetical protein HaLaN_20126 [Haematococcus lacustris]